MFSDAFKKIKKILWAAFLVSLPVTNFPYFPSALGGSKVSVRPLLLYPLLILLLIILPGLWKRKLPRTMIPLLVFIIVVLISSFLPLIAGVTSEMSELTLTSRMMRTLVTLVLGGAIYLVVSLIPENKVDLDFTLKWFYIGLIIALIWGTLQIIYVLDLIPLWWRYMKKIQRHISISRGYSNRIQGLTQEPSWFADQLTALYLPWIFSAVIMNKTVFKRITKWLTVEKILLIWLIIVLTFTYSRSGYITAAVVIGVGAFFWLRMMIQNLDKQPKSFLSKGTYKFLALPGYIRIILSGGILICVLGAALFIAGRQSDYISRMWIYWLDYSTEFEALFGAKSLGGYIRYIGFGPRFIYWETAYRIFTENPFFGVGLGNYTFYFQDFLPATHLGKIPELLKVLVPDSSSIITAKNYFARLLAETGLIGTAAFISFLLTLLGKSLYSWMSKDTEEKFWGAGAILGLIAFLVNSFSYESFAIPNPWILFGLITAAYHYFNGRESQNKEFQAEK